MKLKNIGTHMNMNRQNRNCKIIFCLILLFLPLTLQGQNYNNNNNNNINQNQNTVIINNAPVVEKTKVIEKVKTVVVEKEAPKPKRYARKLPAPVCILNSLWVYTEDLGVQDRYSAPEIVEMLNNTNAHGRNDWRVPTDAELNLMLQNADAVGLGDGPYLFHSCRYQAVLRPVSTGLTVEQQNELKRQERLQEQARREQRLREKLEQERRKEQEKIEQEKRAREAHKRAVDALY